jgi:calcium-dependent protein kinase
VGDILGKGAFGEVRAAVHKESAAQRAIKTLAKKHMDKHEKKQMMNEINVLR